MHGSRNPALLKLLAIGGVLALAAWAPSKAADEDYSGWFVALDLATTQPNSFEQSYAAVVDPPSNFVSRLVVDNDSDFTYKIKVGYGLGNRMGRLSVSYWSFDNEQTSNETLNSNYVYPTIFTYGYNNSGSYMAGPVTAQIASKIKATTIDVEYVRPIAASEKNSLSWLMGLRSATFEEDQGFDGTDSSYTPTTYIQTKHIESDAVGVRVGATAHFGFTPHFAIEGSLVYSFLQASSDAVADQTVIGAGTTVDRNSSSDDHVRGETREIDLRAVWVYGNLGYWAGYSASNWDGFVADPISGGSCCNAGTGMGRSTRESIGFNSLHGGIVFKFGKGGS
ncbi:MAG TPA: Lpg1974 family pore-forming outer membrane protein [Candidatus Binatia bacterium]|nr:Lpg1974 family pore-forming outer membrane protein [Candidatus Binatia bacterium]